MNIPSNLKYTKSHEWVQFIDETTVRVGLSDFAQDSLGSLVFVNLPQEGDVLAQGDNIGDVESVKAVSDVFAPIGGTVSAINEELLDAPEKVNEDPYGAWMVELSNIDGQGDFMDDKAYEAFCKEEE